jgi:hypothetical protein
VVVGCAERKQKTAFGRRKAVRGNMMDFPLTLVPILERAGKLFGQVEIVSRRPDRSLVRSNYGAVYRARGGWRGRWNWRGWAAATVWRR